MQIQGIVNPPSNASIADGLQPVALAGKAAELLVAELHGKWWTAAYRGRVYIGSTPITGTTLTTQSTTSATFALWNPSSAIVVEPIAVDVGLIGTTTVIGTIMATFSNQTPTTTTAVTATVVSANMGASSGPPTTAQAKLLSAATITAATIFLPLFNITTTTDQAVGNLHYDFDGKVALPFNGLMNLSSSPAQSQATLNSYQWAEWPA